MKTNLDYWNLAHSSKKVKSIKDMPDKVYGFIYLLGFTDGTFYIGKKQLYHKTTLPALKNGSIRDGAIRVNKNKNGKRVGLDVLYKESNWLTYLGSSSNIEGKEVDYRAILEYAFSPIELTYLECRHLFDHDVLRNEESLNDNILGKFYKGRL